MMQGLEVASDEADHLLHIASQRAHTVPDANGKSSCFSIHQKLRELYVEECAKASQQPLQYLRPSSHLLEKLVAREQLNTLVLNLYPGNKGYSLSIQMGGDKLSIETAKFAYQEDVLLSYIDNEELPPTLTDLLERSHPELFYSGCVIVQVRDYRQTFPHFVCDTHHVLLRPTTQNLINEVNLLTSEGEWTPEERLALESQLVLATAGPLCLDPSPANLINDVNLLTSEGEWTPEERLALESQLVLATAGPLCLDPSPAVSLVQQRLHHRRHALNTPALRYAARRHGQISANRKRKLDQLSAKPLPHLADFISRRKTQPSRHAARQPSTQPSVTQSSKVQKKDDSIDYLADVQRFSKPLDRPVETIDCTPVLAEEYILETERGPGRVYYIKLSILQRPSNCEYLGQLYVDKEYREGESNGASCRFSLGSRAQANRYIQQFTEIFTEEGRKSVKITHVVPGQPARVICTAGMRERDARMAALVHQQQTAHTLKQVLCAMSQHNLKLQKAQREQQVSSVDNAASTLGVNGLVSHNGPVTNGDITSSPSHSIPQQQQTKPVIMTNPAISALANDLKNSAQQYQQQQQAAANAAAAAAAAAAASASSAANATTVNFVNSQGAPVTNNHHSNAAILSLLNSNPSSAAAQNPTLNQLLNNVITPPNKQQVLTARKMTLTHINPRSIAISPSQQTQAQPVRVSLSSLTNQLSSPQARVQYSTTGVRRLSDNNNSPTTSLGLSMPGLSALLAGTPSADNPVPGANSSNSALLERLSTPPSYPSSSPKPPPAPSPTASASATAVSLNLASVQGALASIPGLQNVQVSIPGLPVPISMSINNSSPHIVTSLPVNASLPMTTTNLAAVTVSGNSPGATLVFTNSSPMTAQLLSAGKTQVAAQTLRTTGTPNTCNIGGQSIQLVGLQRPRGVVAATTTAKPTLMARSVINNQRHTLKVAPANTVVRTADMSGTSGQVLTLSSHQQIQIQALQKQALQLQQFPQQTAAGITVKHQRRRSTADNK